MRRPKNTKENQSSWKSWIGSPTAWLALLLSAGNAFYSIFYYSDELTIITQDESAAYTLDENKVTVFSPAAFVFVNSGTRPVAVTDMWVFFDQPNKDYPEREDCSPVGPRVGLQMVFQPSVLKPHDIMTQTTKFHMQDGSTSTSFSMDFTQENAAKQKDGKGYVLTCGSATYIVGNREFHDTFRIAKVFFYDMNSNRSHSFRLDFGPETLLKRNLLWTSVMD